MDVQGSISGMPLAQFLCLNSKAEGERSDQVDAKVHFPRGQY